MNRDRTPSIQLSSSDLCGLALCCRRARLFTLSELKPRGEVVYARLFSAPPGY
ncbi:hypothetical protein KQ940_20570 [Marinobacterium sp. D7]|uniref:hypothetical protein n=1 Tax=Marinobacterium ramblicola TaxID=2849041 RepID=UPI001C2D7B9E|nr:hypothetical protein [Marinobacterium ramblicola]MBV1790460.1 hypothetical protein [Marinobacterium ramblicola]